MARRGRGLTEGEKALWQQVKESTQPLAPEKKAAAPVVRTPSPAPTLTRIPNFVLGQNAAPEPFSFSSLTPDPMARLLDAEIRTDKRTHDKLRKGKLSPDARIDLHGMTAAKAHNALTGFISRSYQAGHRLVLVITGKGRDPKLDPDAMTERRGVLRHAVPEWLASTQLAPKVLQILPAHRKHGGGGAYYVYLKRRK